MDELISLGEKVISGADLRLQTHLPLIKLKQPNLSAVNLAHYLSIRDSDLRPLQKRLAHVGFSSLGRTESTVLYSLNSVIELLGELAKRDAPHKPLIAKTETSFFLFEQLLAKYN